MSTGSACSKDVHRGGIFGEGISEGLGMIVYVVIGFHHG